MIIFFVPSLSSAVTKKRRWRNSLEESDSAWELSVFKFSGYFCDFFPVNLLLVRSYQA